MTVEDERETWYLPEADGEGTFVYSAHPVADCTGACPLHGPSDHWARDMPLRWDYRPNGESRMLRVCEHGVEHDDPDDWAFRQSRGMYSGRFRPCQCDCPCTCNVDDPPF